MKNYEINEEQIKYLYKNGSIQVCSYLEKWFPKHFYINENNAIDIVDNNGWIKINSESDLPEQGGEYIVFRMSKKSTATYCKSDRWMVPENDYPKTTFQHGITHYRKKEIIPNPIY